jgi:hypothetical protein
MVDFTAGRIYHYAQDQEVFNKGTILIKKANEQEERAFH